MPDMLTTIDPEKQRRAREYARKKYLLLALESVLGGGYLVAFLISGASSDMRDWAQRMSPNPLGALALYFIAFASIWYFLLLPMEYYGGFILPHRYGLSVQNLGEWIGDEIKGVVLSLILGMGVVEVIYHLLSILPSFWWLAAFVVLALLSLILTYLSPLLIVPLFFRLTPIDNADLAERLETLARRAGTRVGGVFTVEMSKKTVAASAALVGLGKTRRILLGDTLYENYSSAEIETILAHELAHHVHGDISRGLLFQGSLILVGLFLTHLALTWGAGRFGFHGPSDIASLPLLALVMGTLLTLCAPVANTLSRKREGLADLYSLEATKKPEAFTSAMIKLTNQNLAILDPEPWIEFLLYSHPSTKRRIERAQAFKLKTGAGHR
jgi:STE24 endopeptidase